ncbi:response regulator transcription factor [Streptomyces sp. DSM 44917]|uniref:Response regulator transcription factor n=1 Tax=Streptomyces boetiae TaxID=3075541 RepID=A0ABU2LD87_9ACTN|nr:response regulator transcription factor [Streptomyces sp. DSM 44917]MDT0309544.1 response regulator transcription factor [Streptomyces sp. DSM 44917]
MIRLLLVHDDYLLRCALRSLLTSAEDIDVVAASSRDVAHEAARRPADLVLLDVDCPGFSALAGMGKPQPWDGMARSGLVVIAPTGRPGLLHRAFEARALGYVSKDAPPERLLDAIRRVAQGSRYVDDALAPDFLSAARMPLTPRELNVLSLAADGASVSEIAGTLWLAEGTVRNYLAAIIRKTGARNRVDAIRISRHAGWV